MDDIFLCANSSMLLLNQIETTMNLLESLGFRPNVAKSQLVPSHCLTHLGLIWDSRYMTIALPEEKCVKTQALAARLLAQPLVSVHLVASIIGLVSSLREEFPYAPLHYRKLQNCFNDNLSKNNDWEIEVALSDGARADVAWWAENCHAPLAPVIIKPQPPKVTVYTDASLKGWGMSVSDGQVHSGDWSLEETELHINYL